MIQQLVGALSGEDGMEPQLLGHQREPDLSKASLSQAFIYPELLAGEFTLTGVPHWKGDDLGAEGLVQGSPHEWLMSEVGLGTLWGEPWGPGSAGWPRAVPLHARWALLAWVDPWVCSW